MVTVLTLSTLENKFLSKNLKRVLNTITIAEQQLAVAQSVHGITGTATQRVMTEWEETLLDSVSLVHDQISSVISGYTSAHFSFDAEFVACDIEMEDVCSLLDEIDMESPSVLFTVYNSRDTQTKTIRL